MVDWVVGFGSVNGPIHIREGQLELESPVEEVVEGLTADYAVFGVEPVRSSNLVRDVVRLPAALLAESTRPTGAWLRQKNPSAPVAALPL